MFVKSLGHDSKYLDYGMGPFAKVQLFRAWNRLLMKLSSSYPREIDFQAIQRKKESPNSALSVNKGEIYLVLDFAVWFSQCSFCFFFVVLVALNRLSQFQATVYLLNGFT